MTLTQEAVLDREQAYEGPDYVPAPWNDNATVNLDAYTDEVGKAISVLEKKFPMREEEYEQIKTFAWSVSTDMIDAAIDFLTHIYDARSKTEKFEQEDSGI